MIRLLNALSLAAIAAFSAAQLSFASTDTRELGAVLVCNTLSEQHSLWTARQVSPEAFSTVLESQTGCVVLESVRARVVGLAASYDITYRAQPYVVRVVEIRFADGGAAYAAWLRLEDKRAAI